MLLSGKSKISMEKFPNGQYFWTDSPSKVDIALEMTDLRFRLDRMNEKFDQNWAKVIVLMIIHQDELSRMGISVNDRLEKVGLTSEKLERIRKIIYEE